MEESNTPPAAADSSVSFCPSFNSYSSVNLVDIATRVSREFTHSQQSSSSKDVDGVVENPEQQNHVLHNEDDFEFVSIATDADAPDFCFDGQIRQVFPVFNRDLLLNEERRHAEPAEPDVRLPLKDLFIDERGGPPSCSSSEADELERVPEGTYCVWSPRRNSTDLSSPSPNRCKKSNSTGSSATSSSSSSSSKRWLKFRDLLKRSNSEGKDPYVFLSKTKGKQQSNEVKTGKKVSAHEAFYVKNRAIKEGDKKRSYLPYRRDLVGFFANVNGLGTTFPPF